MKILVQKIDSNAQSVIRLYLHNNTNYSISAELEVSGFSTNVKNEKHFFLNPGEFKEFYQSFFHLMDKSPIIIYKLTPYSTVGREKSTNGQLKIKAKDFITKLHPIEILDEIGISYPINMDTNIDKRENSKISYRIKQNKEQHLKTVKLFDTKDLATFNPTIDLHLNKLVEDVSKVKPEMAMLFQVSAFDKHLEKAIRLGVDRIFVIHGVGEGKLKKTIINAAKNHPLVKEVKNEYHPKFGFGATEILL